MATYVNNLRLTEITTGDESGTWGTTTNTNWDFATDAFGYGVKNMAGDANETFTMADGSVDTLRSMYLKITSTVAPLTATRTLTIAPNTVSKVWIIENNAAGSQSIIIKQGSGAEITIATGTRAMVYTDGAGAGAAVFLASPTISTLAGTVLVANGGTSLTTLTANNVILGNGASAPTFVAPSTSGNVLTSNGTTWSSTAPATSGTVTSVAASVPSIFSISGSPITTSGTLAMTYSGTALPVANGGTALTAGTSGGVLAYTASGTLASSAALTQYGVVYGGGAGAVPVATAAGTTGQVLTATTSGAPSWAAPAAGGIVYTVTKTTTYTAVANDGVLTNTTGGAFTVNLPASPANGDQVIVADAGGTWGTNNLTVGRNGNNIADVAQDLVCDITGASVQFVYNTSGTATWEVFAQVGGNGGSVVTLTGTQTLTNKTLTSPVLTAPVLGIPASGTLTNATSLPLTTGVTGTLPVANGGTSLATLTANNVILGNGASAPTFVAPSTSGNILTSNGTTWASTTPTAAGFTLGTPVTTTSGTTVDYTGIPSGVKIIIVSFAGVSTNGTNAVGVVLGDAGGFETTDYVSFATGLYELPQISISSATAGFYERTPQNAGAARTGSIVLTLMNSTTNKWVATGNLKISTGAFSDALSMLIQGEKALSAVLTQIRITGGGSTFDAGEVNIMYM